MYFSPTPSVLNAKIVGVSKGVATKIPVNHAAWLGGTIFSNFGCHVTHQCRAVKLKFQ